MIRLSFILGGLAICNAVLAALMPWYIITSLGVGGQTDAFFASCALPQVIFLVLYSTLTHIIVPLLSTEDEKSFSGAAWTFFLGITALFCTLGLTLFLTANFWVPLLVPGLSAANKSLAIKLTEIQMISMVFNALIVVLWCFCHARQQFIWAEFSATLVNVAALVFLVSTLPRFGIVAAAWTTVLNTGLKLVLLLPVLRYWHWPHWKPQLMKEAWRRLKPLIFVQTYRQSDVLIDRFLTSMASSGGLSLLFIAQQINGSINLVSNKAISAPMVPLLARAAKFDDWLGYKLIYRRRILWVLTLTSFGFLSLLIAGWPTLHFLIGHGGITEANVRSLWWILIALAGMLIGGASGQVATAALYTMGNTMTPSKLYVLTFTIFIPIKVLAFMYFGIGGLAVSISVFFGLNFLLQFFTIEKELTLLINSEAERLRRREFVVTQDSQLDREQNARLIEGFVD